MTITIKQTLVDNTKILYSIHCKEGLKIFKVIMMQRKQATINKIPFTKWVSILKFV